MKVTLVVLGCQDLGELALLRTTKNSLFFDLFIFFFNLFEEQREIEAEDRVEDPEEVQEEEGKAERRELLRED